MHPWIGYETLYLARELGWLPPEVALREGKVAGDSLAALRAGTVDAAALTLDEVLLARAAGIPLVVVLVFDASAGADVVLARPGIEKVADLTGRRIGVERSGLGAMVLSTTLERAELTAEAVTVIDTPPDRQLVAWRDGHVDAVVTYEPTASLLEREGARRLLDSRQMPDVIFDVLAARSDRTPLLDAPLAGLIAAHFRALDHLRVHRQDAVYRIAARQGVDAADVQQALAGVVLPGLAANRGYLAPGSRLAKAAAALDERMARYGLLAGFSHLDALLEPRYLPADEGAAQ
jgi:NitT/TauT family transport system substrate-binding protein